jgi:hypothetical protein
MRRAYGFGLVNSGPRRVDKALKNDNIERKKAPLEGAGLMFWPASAAKRLAIQLSRSRGDSRIP